MENVQKTQDYKNKNGYLFLVKKDREQGQTCKNRKNVKVSTKM